MIRKLEGVLDDMCNVIEYYERKTRVEALAEGIIKGEVNTMIKVIEKIEKKMNMSLEEAMDFLEIDEELKHRIYVRLGEELE